MCGVAILHIARTSHAQGGPPPTPVHVAPVQLEQVQERRMVTGELRSVRRALVATREAGIVDELPLMEGQVVKRGDVLARLDADLLKIDLLQEQAELKAAEATVAERKAELEWRERDLANVKNLSAGGASNPKELYDAESAALLADARHSAAKAQVDVIQQRTAYLEKRLGDMAITAPFDGSVVRRLVEVGEWAAEGDPIAELVAVDELDAWLNVQQDYAGAIIGKRIAVIIAIDATAESHEVTEVRTVPDVDARSRKFALIARLKNPSGTLAPGMSISGYVPTGETAQRLTIPRDAVLRSSTGPYAYIVRSAGSDAPPMAAMVNVRILFGHGDRWVVEGEGLAAGDMAVVEGNERLFPMAPVQPIPSAHHAAVPAAGGAPAGEAFAESPRP